jgi:hypothetical protein
VPDSPVNITVSELDIAGKRSLIAEQHEVAHWMQHRCTAIGGFLALLRCARERTMHQFLGRSSRELLSAVHDRRITHRKPLFNVQTGGHIFPLLRLGTQSFLAAERTFHLWNTRTVFFERSRAVGVSDPCAAYIRSCAAIDQMLSGRLTKDWSGLLAEQGGKRGKDRNWPVFLHNDHIIDLKDLFEGCSSLFELAVMDSLSMGDETERRLGRVLASSYGKAIVMAFRELRLGTVSLPAIRKTVLTLLACFDLAFDAPVYPFSDSEDMTLKWHELYPPHRFLRALVAARKLGLASANGIAEYRLALSELSGMRSAQVSPATVPGRVRSLLNGIMKDPTLRSLDPQTTGYKRALAKVAASFDKIRHEEFVLWYVTTVNRVKQKEGCGYLTDILLDVVISRIGRSVTRPAIQLDRDDTTLRTPGEGFAILYLYVTAINYALFDVFFGYGQIARLPHDDYGVLDTFAKVLDSAYSFDVSPLLSSS